MPITFKCNACGQQLQVGDTLAGKRVKCPKCQGTAQVPAAEQPAATSSSWSGGSGASSASSAAASAGGASATGWADNWHIKTPEGQEYGPVSRAQVDAWVAEQRITSDCQLWQEGWPNWQWAGTVIPSLAATQTPATPATPNFTPTATPTSSYPTQASSYPTQSYPTYPTTNPYQAPVDYSTGAGYGASSTRYTRPHRGGLILTFGILSFVICAFFGPAAWVMGNADLRQMKMGLMDREGEGLTQAGRIMGMIASILMILVLFFYLAMFVLLVVMGAAGGAR